jgi:hypothetical protein
MLFIFLSKFYKCTPRILRWQLYKGKVALTLRCRFESLFNFNYKNRARDPIYLPYLILLIGIGQGAKEGFLNPYAT